MYYYKIQWACSAITETDQEMIKYLILLLLFATTLASEDKTLGLSQANPAASCHEIYQRNPTSKGSVGQYWIKTSEGLF